MQQAKPYLVDKAQSKGLGVSSRGGGVSSAADVGSVVYMSSALTAQDGKLGEGLGSVWK